MNIAWIWGTLDFIPLPLPSVKIQIIGGKVYLQNIAGWYQQTFCFQKFVPGNVLPLHLNQTFPPVIWKGESEWIKSRLPFIIFSTLLIKYVRFHDLSV